MADLGSSKPAGWYPSSRTPGMERYWNGDFWTSDYRPSTAVEAARDAGYPPVDTSTPAVAPPVAPEQATDVWTALQSSPASQQPIFAPGVKTEFSRGVATPIPTGYGQAPPNGYSPYPNGGYPGPATPAPEQGLSVAAFILAFFAPIVGAILGHVAYNKSKKLGRPNGFSLAAIIVGWLFTLFTLLFWIPFFVSLFGGLSSLGDSEYESDYSYDDSTVSDYDVAFAAEDELTEAYPIDGYWSVQCEESLPFEAEERQDCKATAYFSGDYITQDYGVNVMLTGDGDYYDPEVIATLDREFEGALKDPGMIVND